MKSFDFWPDETNWKSHCQSFQPFHVRCLSLFSVAIPSSPSPPELSFPYYSIQSLHTSSSSRAPSSTPPPGDCSTPSSTPFRSPSPSVDILCINPSISSEFSGEESKLQYLPLKLHQYLEAYLSLQQGNQTHFLTNLPDIQLYLSQVPLDLLSQTLSLPPLPLPPVFHCVSLFQTNLWINLSAVKSSLHYDSNHNILIVYEGYKDVILISPQHSSHLSPSPVHSSSCNHSNLTSEELELVIQQEHIPTHRIRVSQGQAIFIPEGWWHQVSSGCCSYAMNYWFRSPLHQLISSTAELRTNDNDSSVSTSSSSLLLPYLLRTALHTMLTNQLEQERATLFAKPSPQSQPMSYLSTAILPSPLDDRSQLSQRFVNASFPEMASYWVAFAKQVLSFLTYLLV
jgi:hypothetical protein